MFGATVPVSSLPGESAMTCMAHLPQGQDRGLIAVAVYYRQSGDKIWGGCVIELTRGEDGCVHVNLEHPWVPEGEPIVQVDHLGIHLTDVASGDQFTTHQNIARRHGLHHVPDGNLLMRYVAGKATIDEVRAAATAHAEEKSARERLAEIEPKLARVEALAADTGVALDELGTEYRRLREIEQRARALRDAVNTEFPNAMPNLLADAYHPLDTVLK